MGHEKETERYLKLSREIGKAYVRVFADRQGRLKKEFQTAYVLPLQFGIVSGPMKKEMAVGLLRLMKKADYHLGTGFTGTPYLLFALADNGYADAAYKVLLQKTSPSWLYEVLAGGTTIWERWDALRPDGSVNIGDLTGGSEEKSNGGMVSFNHYSYGAVGAFLYQRVLGLEPLTPGYRTFRMKPVPGGGLAYARGYTVTPYGVAGAFWEINDGEFRLEATVPVSTECEIVMPDGKTSHVGSGTHVLTCRLG